MKTGKKKKTEFGKVQHIDVQGKREFKYEFLNENQLSSINWNYLNYFAPNYYFTNKNFDEIKNYESYIKV